MDLHMRAQRMKSLGAALGLAAVLAAVAMSLDTGVAAPTRVLAGGSGDSATGTVYVSPTVPAMKLDPTDATMGATITAEVSATALATTMASPTFKASPPAGCVNNGQCP